MAAVNSDYPFTKPTNGQITITQLLVMTTAEVNAGTAANAAYAAGWQETANFSAYKGGTVGGSGIANYMSKGFNNSTVS